MAMVYTVTVKPRGGRGWRVRCVGLPDDDDWNPLGQTVSETFHRSETAARARAAELALQFGAKLLD